MKWYFLPLHKMTLKAFAVDSRTNSKAFKHLHDTIRYSTIDGAVR